MSRGSNVGVYSALYIHVGGIIYVMVAERMTDGNQ